MRIAAIQCQLEARAAELRRQIAEQTARPQNWKTRDSLWSLRQQLLVVDALITGQPEGEID